MSMDMLPLPEIGATGRCDAAGPDPISGITRRKLKWQVDSSGLDGESVARDRHGLLTANPACPRCDETPILSL